MNSIIGKDLYSTKYNIRFFHITKNGMTSMIKTLSLDWTLVDDIDRLAKIIAIIRDPFERFISGFLYINRSGECPNKYLDRLLKEGAWDGHNLSQHFYLNEPNHKRNINDVDHFILFENIEAELANLGINNILHLNKRSISKKDEIRNIMLPRKIEILNFYRDDLNLWRKIKDNDKV